MAPRRPGGQDSAAAAAELSLLVVAPERVFPVSLGPTPLTLGSDAEAAIRIEDPTLAPLHLSLRARPDGVEVEALGGHAALLNEVQLSSASLARVGDQIDVGATSLLVMRHAQAPRRAWSVLSPESFDTVLEIELARSRRLGRPVALWLIDSPAAERHGRDELWRLLGPILPTAVVGELGPRALQLLLLETSRAESTALLGRASTLLGRAGIRFAFGAAAAPQDGEEGELLRERALAELESDASDEEPILVDPVMGRLFGLAERLGTGTQRVHLVGEPGAGKATLARAIHHRGVRASGPFVQVDCAQLSPGGLDEAIVRAAGGTLFLRGTDRLGQRLVLGDVPDGQLVTSSRSSADRSAPAVVHVPPLRERPTDILALADGFLTRFARTLGRDRRVLSATARRLIAEDAWTGNVRALKVAMAHAVLATRGPEIQLEALPPALLRSARTDGRSARNDLRSSLKAAEREALLSALAATSWNVTRAAELLSLPRRTVVYRMSRLGLRRPGR